MVSPRTLARDERRAAPTADGRRAMGVAFEGRSGRAGNPVEPPAVPRAALGHDRPARVVVIARLLEEGAAPVSERVT